MMVGCSALMCCSPGVSFGQIRRSSASQTAAISIASDTAFRATCPGFVSNRVQSSCRACHQTLPTTAATLTAPTGAAHRKGASILIGRCDFAVSGCVVAAGRPRFFRLWRPAESGQWARIRLFPVNESGCFRVLWPKDGAGRDDQTHGCQLGLGQRPLESSVLLAQLRELLGGVGVHPAVAAA